MFSLYGSTLFGCVLYHFQGANKIMFPSVPRNQPGDEITSIPVRLATIRKEVIPNAGENAKGNIRPRGEARIAYKRASFNRDFLWL